jgi:squalene cyclase
MPCGLGFILTMLKIKGEKKMKKEKKLKFENCKTYGEQIEAIVRHYYKDTLNLFVLEEALAKLKQLEKEKDKLLEDCFKEEGDNPSSKETGEEEAKIKESGKDE